MISYSFIHTNEGEMCRNYGCVRHRLERSNFLGLNQGLLFESKQLVTICFLYPKNGI